MDARDWPAWLSRPDIFVENRLYRSGRKARKGVAKIKGNCGAGHRKPVLRGFSRPLLVEQVQTIGSNVSAG